MFFSQDVKKRSYRCWLYGPKHRSIGKLEISWFSNLYGLSFNVDDEDWTASLQLGLVGLYLSICPTRRLVLRKAREVGIRFHGGAAWWKLWTHRDEWTSTTPRWRDGNFNLIDFLLGRSVCTQTMIEAREVLIPMPEKAYWANAELIEFCWKRPRWPARKMLRCSIDIPGGIPHAGKGENSWDCGDDATFGMTTGKCASIVDGIGQLVTSCLRTRVKNGGWSDFNWTREPEAMS